MQRPVVLHFSRLGLIIVVVVEGLLIAIGAIGTLLVVFGGFAMDVRLRGILAALALGLSGSAAYYLRKIYRAAFDGRLEIDSPDSADTLLAATTIYLLGRPLMSIPLSLAASLALVLTYTTVAPSDISPTENIVYVLGAAGFLTGFLGGRVIEQIESGQGV